jgi:hypothetical protein
VPESKPLKSNETIYDYLEQHPEAAASMPFSILMNSSQQTLQHKTHNRSGLGRLKVVVLALSSTMLSEKFACAILIKRVPSKQPKQPIYDTTAACFSP